MSRQLSNNPATPQALVQILVLLFFDKFDIFNLIRLEPLLH